MSEEISMCPFSHYQILCILVAIIFFVSAAGCLQLGGKRGHPPTPYEPEVQQRLDTNDVSETHPNATLQRTEAVEYWIVAFVNYERLESGREPLVWSPRLAQVADYRSYDMWNRSYFGHYDPHGQGFENYLEQFGYSRYNYGSENIAVKNYRVGSVEPSTSNPIIYDDPREFARALVVSWMYSGEHRWALMHADYSVTGVGVYGGPSGEVKATQLFVDRERFDRAVDANTTDEFRVPVAEEDPLEDESGLENYPSHLGSNDDDDT